MYLNPEDNTIPLCGVAPETTQQSTWRGHIVDGRRREDEGGDDDDYDDDDGDNDDCSERASFADASSSYRRE